MTNSYPRESVEYVKFADVTIDGAPVTVFDYAVTTGATRPTGWTPAQTVDGKQAFLLDGTRPRGDYKVFVRVTDNPEVPVIEAGRFTIT